MIDLTVILVGVILIGLVCWDAEFFGSQLASAFVLLTFAGGGLYVLFQAGRILGLT